MILSLPKAFRCREKERKSWQINLIMLPKAWRILCDKSCGKNERNFSLLMYRRSIFMHLESGAFDIISILLAVYIWSNHRDRMSERCGVINNQGNFDVHFRCKHRHNKIPQISLHLILFILIHQLSIYLFILDGLRYNST